MELPSTSAFKTFKEKYGDLKAFYPSCGFDYSPSEIFSDVLFLDKDEKAISELKNRGLNAVVGDALNFDYSCDLLILINPSIDAGKLIPRFKPRFVICNNFHGTADELSKLEGYNMEGMLGVDFWLFVI